MIDLEKYRFRKGFSFENRFDLKTRIGNYEVSTVDLGLNHQFDETLPPLYYETMIFKVKNGEVDYSEIYCDRYTTQEEAELGHQKAIDYVKNYIKGGSMKTIKLNGIELLEMIKRNEIETNTKVNVYYDDVLRTTLIFDGYNLNWKQGEFKVAYFYDGLCHFEIEGKEIEKLARVIEGCVTRPSNNTELMNKLNEVIDAVNELKNKED